MAGRLGEIADALAGWRHWILGEDGRTPVEAGFGEHMDWMLRVGGPSARVALDETDGTVVSTVFISGPVGRGGVPPTWHFETMVSAPDADRVTARYLTWEQAEEGHASILASLAAPGFR